MLTEINPKLPMRDIRLTKSYYLNTLGFQKLGEYENYLIVGKDSIQIHFFQFDGLNPKENYGQVYIRTNDVDALYKAFIERNVAIHPNVKLETKPWGQREFSILDPDHNLLTFGQSVNDFF
jgi:extradiol dioxygenase family protein